MNSSKIMNTASPSSSTNPPKVTIIHGWAGGPKLGRYFAKNLGESGFKVIKNPQEADLIIAHSTGCYFLAKDFKAKLIMCINPPYWPGNSIVRRWAKMSQNEARLLIKNYGKKRFVLNWAWGIYYIFAKPAYTWSLLKNQSHLDFIEKLADKKIILVRNTDDEFCSPEIKLVVRRYQNIKYTEIPGYHSNYYTNPQPYIDLLLKEL